MRVDLTDTRCTVTREPGDPRIRRSGWGAPSESHLLHRVKVALRAQGFDVVKRRLQADGHLMGDDKAQYLRARDWSFLIYDPNWAVLDLAAEYASTGMVELTVKRPERAAKPVRRRAKEPLPPCAQAMKCYCAGHARGLPASEPCDTREG